MDIKVSRKYIPDRVSTEKFKLFKPRIFSVKKGIVGSLQVKMPVWLFYDRAGLANALVNEGILIRAEQQGVYHHDEKSGRMIYTPNPKWDRSKEDIHTLDLDKLRNLPPDHRIFELFAIRSSDLNQPPEKVHEARINAVIGRFCAEEEEERVLEYVPSADTFCHLAEHFLAKGDIGKAKDCVNEAVKYDVHGEKVRSLTKIVDFFLENKLEESIQELCEAVAIDFQVLTFGGSNEGFILEEGMTYTEKVYLTLKLAMECSDSKTAFLKNLSKIVTFIAEVRRKSMVEWPYLKAILELCERFSLGGNLQRLLELELKNIAEGNYQKEYIPVIVDNPACPDGYPVDAWIDLALPIAVPIAKKIIESLRREREMKWPTCSPRYYDFGQILEIKYCNYEPRDGWGWSDEYLENNLSRSAIIDGCFKTAILFSINAKEFSDNFETMVDFLSFLCLHGVLVRDYLTALCAFGKRFPEYKGRLAEILKNEKENILAPNHPEREIRVTITLHCSDYGTYSLKSGSSLQPVPQIENRLSERYSPEEMRAFECQREGVSIPPISPKKCLVLDCDGVLWKGIVEEDGVEGIEINRAFQDFIKELKKRGVLLALNTRNDRIIIDDVFIRSEMPLGPGDFAAVEANWEQKDRNLRAIAKRLNIGLDSMVFLDDSPQERAMVREMCSEVFVPDLPEDAGLFAPFLEGLADLFAREKATEEDKKRTELYAALDKSAALLTSAPSREEGLRLLEMKAGIQINDMSSIPRFAQVTQRTNQFNLTTRRYDEKDIRGFIQDPGSKVFSLRLADKFADHGIVGLVIVRKKDEGAYIIDTFALSCRALGKTVEQTFMAQIVDILRKEGVKHLRGVYIPTERNGKVKDLYERFGFRKTGEEDNGTIYWELDLEKAKVEASPYITSVPFLP